MLIKTDLHIGRQSVLLITNDTRLVIELESVKKHLTLFEKVQDPRTKRFIEVAKGYYYLFEEHDNHLRMYVSINSLGLILDAIKRSGVQHRVSINKIEYKKHNIRLNLKSDYVPREEQDKFIKALSVDNEIPSYLLDLQPGYGKTLIGYFTCVNIHQRFCVLVKPTFLNKWVEDIKKYTHLEDGDIYIISGKESLIKLFDMKKDDINKIKVYVTSMRTITNYYYLSFEEDFYKIKPYHFMEYLGIDIVLNDESHKEFEALFKVIMWMNPYKLLGLSATMESNKPGMNYFYNLIYPKKDRLVSMFGLNKYLSLYFYNYRIAKGIYLQHKTHRGYNHIMFEQSIMKNMYLLNDYIEMILSIIDKYYIEYKKNIDYGIDGKEKCLLFFSTIDMCTIFTNKIKTRYPDYNVQRYVEKDKYEDMLQGDIIISTPGSLGTGIDVPGLITAIQTVSIGDMQLNIQAAGRLREIKGKEVLYISVQTDGIEKQKSLKIKRLNILRDRVRSIHYDSYDTILGLKGKPDGYTSNPKQKVYQGPRTNKGYFYRPFGNKNKSKKTFRR